MPSREASLRNLEKARAKRRPPRPWRSRQETRVIKQLVWQWLNSGEPGKWSGRAVARWLDVSHTYIQKLVRKFQTDPDRMRRVEAGSGRASCDQLNLARQHTLQARERGYLRQPIRWRVVEFVGMRVVVPTKAEERRRAAKALHRPLRPYVPFHELPLWAGGPY